MPSVVGDTRSRFSPLTQRPNLLFVPVNYGPKEKKTPGKKHL